MKTLLLTFLVWGQMGQLLLADMEAHKVQPFLKQYCIECHGEKKQKGDIRLDQFAKMDSDSWQLVYEQLYHEEMPPSDEKQPSKEMRESLMAYILSHANEKKDAKKKESTGYRKMNQREYNYTVRDLLGLNKGDFNPGVLVYADKVEKGFDTEAESLIMSSELLIEYLQAAERSVNQALFTSDYSKPSVTGIKLNLKTMGGGDRRFASATKEHLITRDGGASFYSKSDEAVIKISGKYKVSITAEPIDQFKYHGGTLFPPFKEKFKLDLGTKHGGTKHLKKTFVLENRKSIYSEVLWLDKNYTPYVRFANGSPKPPATVRQAQRRKKIPHKSKPLLPGIKIHEIKIEGPIIEQWPPVTYRTTFALDTMPDLSSEKIRERILYKFLARAYRRLPSESEYSLYKARVKKEYAESKSWHRAMVKTMSAILVSPDFLYIKTSQGELNDFELASRLSYFFWSSMPDKELFTLAHQGKLKDPEIYLQQIARMYKDPKAQRFMESFVTQWLSLDKLGTMAPEKKGKFSAYYQVENFFRKETIEYFKYVLLENRSINEFIDSNYSFMNKRLADFYKVPFKGTSSKLVKATLPSNSPRGGLITQGSILTLTANGVETTPIERGHWVLDELMGTPPPPPPKATPALTPDLRGIKTVREQLIKHRSDPNCIECHLKMDPPGFALEAFDPIGRFRTKYDKK